MPWRLRVANTSVNYTRLGTECVMHTQETACSAVHALAANCSAGGGLGTRSPRFTVLCVRPHTQHKRKARTSSRVWSMAAGILIDWISRKRQHLVATIKCPCSARHVKGNVCAPQETVPRLCMTGTSYAEKACALEGVTQPRQLAAGSVSHTSRAASSIACRAHFHATTLCPRVGATCYTARAVRYVQDYALLCAHHARSPCVCSDVTVAGCG